MLNIDSITIITIVLTVISYAALHTLHIVFTLSLIAQQFIVYNDEQARELQLYHLSIPTMLDAYHNLTTRRVTVSEPDKSR